MSGYINRTQRINAVDFAQKQVLGEYSLNKNHEDFDLEMALDNEVRDLMDRNELENATIIFSKQAIQLFAHLFGNSMEAAVQRGLKGLEERMDKKIQDSLNNHMVDVLNKSSIAIQEFLDESVSETLSSFVEPIKPNPIQSTPVIVDKIGNSKKALTEYSPYLLNVFKSKPNTEIRLSEACNSVLSQHKIEWYNANHTMDYLLLHEPNLSRARRGFYIYKV